MLVAPDKGTGCSPLGDDISVRGGVPGKYVD
jgi:hypothetical protein